MAERLPVTRTALLESRARRAIARRGVELLRSKREALAAELLAVVRDVVTRRERLDQLLRDATRALAMARGLEGEEAIASLALAAGRDIPLDVELRKVWGIPIPEVTAPRLLRDLDARGVSPLDMSLQAHLAASRHEEALEALLGVCSSEVRLRRLGEEIRKTARRIGALEELILPSVAADIRRIGFALEERAREDMARRKRFKVRRERAAQAAAATGHDECKRPPS